MNVIFCEDFPEFFKGITLDLRTMKLHFDDGRIMTRTQFKKEFEGHLFVTNVLHTETTKSAWYAFARSTGFRPPIIRGYVEPPDVDPDSSFWR